MTDQTNFSADEFDLSTMSQLVDAARDGDQQAHSEICRRIQGHLTQMAGQHLDAKLRRKLNPSDIVQATMVRMVQGFSDFRGLTSAEFYGWLNSILKNEVNTTRRNYTRQRRDVRMEVDAASKIIRERAHDNELPDQTIQLKEKITRFREAVGRLPRDYAKVIQLRNIEELPFNEVAAQMGRSVNATSKLWSRALIALQQELVKFDDSIAANPRK